MERDGHREREMSHNPLFLSDCLFLSTLFFSLLNFLFFYEMSMVVLFFSCWVFAFLFLDMAFR